MTSKTCNDCRQDLPLEAFGKCSTNPDGLQYKCKACRKLLNQINADSINAYQRRHHAKNSEKINAGQRDYWRTRRDKKRQHNATYLKKNREQNSQKCQKRYAANREAYKQQVRQWRAANPDAVSAINHNRRAREKQADGTHTAQEWADKKTEYGHRCAYCLRRVKLTKHHVVPLSRGGSNWITNIVPACQSCNSRIGTKTVVPNKGVSS